MRTIALEEHYATEAFMEGPGRDIKAQAEAARDHPRVRENIHYTFGGFNWTPAFLDLLLQVGAERIMFSTDHPYASMTQARAFLDRLPVSPAERERISHSNAERLLRLFRERDYEAGAEARVGGLMADPP